MKIKIVGYAHLKGISRKTKKPYDFVSLSIVYHPEHDYFGDKALELTTKAKYLDALTQQKLPFDCNIHREYRNKEVVIEEFERG